MKIKIFLVTMMLALCASFTQAHAEYNVVYPQETKQEKADRIARSKNKPTQTKSKAARVTSPQVNVVTGQALLSPQKQYKVLIQNIANLEGEISMINSSLPDLSRGKAKKALKRMQTLERELNTIKSTIALYPKSITDPQYNKEVEQLQKEAFMEMLNQKTEQLIASDNPYQGLISTDPQLEKTYRNFIATGGVPSFGQADFVENKSSNDSNNMTKGGKSFFSVLFAISSKPLPSSSFPYVEVYSQKLKNGKIAYFAGSFENKTDANTVCTQILSKGQFRDSFVVFIK